MTNDDRSRKPPCSVDGNLAQDFDIVESLTGAEHHRGERVVGDDDRHAGFKFEAGIEVFQQRAAAVSTIPESTISADSSGQGLFQGHTHGIDDDVDLLGNGGLDFLGRVIRSGGDINAILST